MGTSRPSVHTLCCMHLYKHYRYQKMLHLGRINERSICFDQDILYGKKEFGAKPSEKKMMMKKKMRRLEAIPEHESRSLQRVRLK